MAERRINLVSQVPDRQSVVRWVGLQNQIAHSFPQANFVTPDSVAASLLTEKFAGRQFEFFLDDQAHVVARVSPTLTDANGKPLGLLGFFAAKSESSAHAVLAAGVEWLRQQGCVEIFGPIDGDTWHSYRLNTGPFEKPLFLSEPGNPPDYPGYWTSAGFTEAAGYHSKFVDDVAEILPATALGAEKAEAAGYRIRNFRRNAFCEDLDVIYDLSTQVFLGNFLYEPIGRDAFRAIYEPAKKFIDPELVVFGVSPSGQEVGFLFCIPDLGQAVRAMKGRRDLWAKLKFVWNRRHVDTVNYKSIGVLSEHRRSSVAALMMHTVYERALSRGWSKAHLCLIRDGNPSGRLDGGASQLFRRYVLYRFAGKLG